MSLGLIEACCKYSGSQNIQQLLLDSWRTIYENNKSKKLGIGRAGYGSIAQVFRNEISIQQVQSAQQSRKYPGNAPPMRAIPLGFLPDRGEFNMNEWATENANSTHPHPKAIAASIAIARACEFVVVYQMDQEKVFSYCLEWMGSIDKEMTTFFQTLDELPSPKEILFFQQPHTHFDSNLHLNFFETLCGSQPTCSFPEGVFGLPSDGTLF